MRKLLKTVLAIALAGTLSAAISAGAASIFITNNSFEDPVSGASPGPPITGWTIGGGGAGVWNINDFPYGFWTVPAPDGKQIAFVSSATEPGGPPLFGGGSPASISQVLGDLLLADTVYSLTGYVGHPIGHPATYTVELLAGGNVLDSLSSAAGSQGTFDPFLLTFDSSGSLYVGQSLEIRLSSSDSQTGFDKIALTIPEPEIYAMLAAGLGLMGFVARRRRPQAAAN